MARAAELGRALIQAQADLQGVLASTAWLATWPFRAIGRRLPEGARRAVRGSAKLGWWTVSMQLPRKLRERRLQIDDLAGVSENPAPLLRLEAPGAASRPKPMAHPPPRPLPRAQPKQDRRRDEPVDIVICVHNALGSVRACIESVLRCTMPPYRIVVVDDGSGSETAAYLDQIAGEQGLTLIRNAEAQGYTRAANTGLKAVAAPWVVLLNSDTIVSPDWLDRMWAHGDRDASIGASGPSVEHRVGNLRRTSSLMGPFWRLEPIPLPLGITAEEMAGLVEGGALGAVPMPFINGFCCMIRSQRL